MERARTRRRGQRARGCLVEEFVLDVIRRDEVLELRAGGAMTGPRTTAHATGELHVDGMHQLRFGDGGRTPGDEEVAG